MRAGEDDFRRLYDRHYDAVHAYFRRRTGPASAPDLTAEVFTIAWRRLTDVPGGAEALLWLYGVAGNVAAHQRRSLARTSRLETRLQSVPTSPPNEPDAQVVRRAEFDRVIAAADRLRPADQEILRLAAWEELPHDQIAQLLGCSVAAVDQRLHRARKRLAKGFSKITRPVPPHSEKGDRR
jgi:RNA polymerase sigma-70 factor (ECF subfamily)